MYRELIINKVTKSPGIRHVDLSLAIMESVNPSKFNYEPYYVELMKAVDEGEIVALDYTTNNEIKSIYFPKGTKLLVHVADYVLR